MDDRSLVEAAYRDLESGIRNFLADAKAESGDA